MNRKRNECAQVDKTYEQLTGRKPRTHKKKLPHKGFWTAILTFAVLIILCAAAYVTILEKTQILQGVKVAGIDLSGMTRAQATQAISDGIGTEYQSKDMLIGVYDETLTITPATSKAQPDALKAAVLAVKYGHNLIGQVQSEKASYASENGMNIDISGCLNLDTRAIEDVLDGLTEKFGTPLKQTSYEVIHTEDGTTVEKIVITKGTPEYQLDLSRLMEQITEAYSLRIFDVVADCGKTEPEPFDMNALYEQYVTKPVAASMDPNTFEVIAELDGYGFDLAQATADFEATKPGETLELTFTTISAETTGADITEKINRDVLGQYSITDLGTAETITNLKTACSKLNGIVLNPQTVFSLNTRLGQPSKKAGFVEAPSDKDGTSTMGGGLSRLSSALYYCLLSADLEVIQRQSHSSLVSYIGAGFDAYVQWGDSDLRFKNTSAYPISINAQCDGSALTVTIMGTNESSGTVTLVTNKSNVQSPKKVYSKMDSNNAFGYKNGGIITQGTEGCHVDVYRTITPQGAVSPSENKLVSASDYIKQDTVICKTK